MIPPVCVFPPSLRPRPLRIAVRVCFSPKTKTPSFTWSRNCWQPRFTRLEDMHPAHTYQAFLSLLTWWTICVRGSPRTACVLSPPAGDGASQAAALSQEWVRLDPADYPGAGPDGVTADGQMDPLLAFAYDSVFVAASAARAAQEAISLAGGGNLTGIALDRCVQFFFESKRKKPVPRFRRNFGRKLRVGQGATLMGDRRVFFLEPCTAVAGPEESEMEK